MQIIVMGHPDLSSQLCEAGAESAHPPSALFSHRMNYPLLTLWKWLLVTSTTSWMPLDDVNLLIWKEQVQKQSMHWCVWQVRWGQTIWGFSEGWDQPLHDEQRLPLSFACWSLPPRLTPATPKEIPLPKLKTVLTQILIQHSPFLVKSFFTVRVYTLG